MQPFDYSAYTQTVADRLAENLRRLPRAMGAGFRPPPRLLVSEWAERYRRFGDDAPIPGPWKHAVAPYLVEIMDCLSPFHPATEVSILKCSQSGGSAAGENWLGYIADVAPGPTMLVQATLPAAHDWSRNKFWPMVRATPKLDPKRRGAVLAAEAGGSTKGQIDFARSGYLLLAGANSAATLTQKTIRYAIEDDLDQWPDDLDGQGSPEAMVDSRLKVFRNRGLSKRLKIGTPTVKGASKIDAAYQRSDRRRFYLCCPDAACGSRFDPTWEYQEGGARDIHWPDGDPGAAYLVTPCCGQVVEHWQKIALMRADGWLATVEIDGAKPPRHMADAEFQTWRERDVTRFEPGFHISGLITAFDSWGELARKYDKAKGDQNALKGWVMLDLGEAFEVRGEAPAHERLAALVEQHFGQGRRLPIGALATTAGVDVQGDGLYYVLKAWGPSAESWDVEAAFVPGATDVEGEGAWADLDQIMRRPVVYPGGMEFPIDQICVDAGYHTPAAQAFCRGRSNRLAVFGRAGWTLPVLGRGEALRYETQGQYAGRASKRMEDRAFIVGTFGVKTGFYGYLRQTLKVVDAEGRGERLETRGRCHFGNGLPADYFEQITAETVETRVVNGYARRVWVPIKSRPNHYLDCNVYNFAASAKLKLETLTPDEWAALEVERCGERQGQADLFDRPLAAPAVAPPAAPQVANSIRDPAPAGGWLNPTENWLG